MFVVLLFFILIFFPVDNIDIDVSLKCSLLFIVEKKVHRTCADLVHMSIKKQSWLPNLKKNIGHGVILIHMKITETDVYCI